MARTTCLVVVVTIFVALYPMSSASKDVDFRRITRLVRQLSVPASDEEKQDRIINDIKKTSMKGKAFKYMDTLYEALERETQKLDNIRDESTINWVIYGRNPDFWTRDSASPEKCTLGFKTIDRPGCKLTRVEYLISLKHRSSDYNATAEEGVIEVNGRTFHRSKGTVKISRSAVFDLTDLFIGNPSNNESITNFTIKADQCHFSHPRRSMLYEYCNIDNKTLDLFWAMQRRKKQRKELSQGSVEERVSNVTYQTNASHSEQSLESVSHPNSSETLNHEGEPGGRQENEIMPKRDRKEGKALSVSRKLRKRRHTVYRTTKKEVFVPVIEKCERKKWRLDFLRDLRLVDIIRPYAVDMGYCSGSCIHADKFSYVDKSVTSHAVLANIAKGTKKAQCVPHRMATLTVLKMLPDVLVSENLHHTIIRTCRCV